MAELSDCIIVVLEGESTFAELGAFAMNSVLAKIVMVINDNRYRDSQSFINQGPVAKINKVSKFKPVIHADMESLLSVADEVTHRLNKIERKYNTRIDLSDYDHFTKSPPKAKMFFMLDLITLFSPVRKGELIELLRAFYGENRFDIDFELALLEALGFLRQADRYSCRPSFNWKLNFVFGRMNVIRFRADIINCYHKKSRTRLGCLNRNE